MRATASVRLSSKGQVVIPAPVRRKLRLVAGQRLEVEAVGDDRLVLRVPGSTAADIEGMLRRAHAWTVSTGRDLVEELHARRRAERAEEKARRARGRP